ncbi:MAG: efflux RND transporter periplasmic adaptor subunit [Pseudomonadota bacterium]
MSDKTLIASLIAIGIAVWLLSGSIGGGTVGATEGGPAPVSSEIPLVRAVQSTADTREMFLEVRAQTRANRMVSVRSEVAGRVEALPGIKGSVVRQGDLLCRIAVDTRQADLDEARAELKSAQLEYDGMLDLQRRGLQSEINVARASAALEGAKARANRAELALEKTRIVAPFDGVVDEQPVEIGDYLGAGQVCVVLMEVDPMLVVGQVAEKNIASVKLGDEVDVRLLTGAHMQGQVTFIGRAPDMTTRTYPVEVTVSKPGSTLRAGLTAVMKLPLGKELAHLISPASLVLNDAGQVGVRIVDDADTVRFMPVSIVSESTAGVWINGLPGRVRLITVGQEDVFDGQVVKVDLTPLTSVVSS